MVRFSKIEPDGTGGLRETQVRVLAQSDIVRCPHFIFMPSHYRADGSCKCNDPAAAEMAEWGYKWSKKSKRWECES